MAYQLRLSVALAIIIANLLVFSALAANNFLAPDPTPTVTPRATFTPNPAFARRYISPTPTRTPTPTLRWPVSKPSRRTATLILCL